VTEAASEKPYQQEAIVGTIENAQQIDEDLIIKVDFNKRYTSIKQHLMQVAQCLNADAVEMQKAVLLGGQSDYSAEITDLKKRHDELHSFLVLSKRSLKKTVTTFFTGELSKRERLNADAELQAELIELQLTLLPLFESVVGKMLIDSRDWKKRQGADRSNWLNTWVDTHKPKEDVSPVEMMNFRRTAAFLNERMRLEQTGNTDLVLIDWDREIRTKQNDVIPLHPAFEELISRGSWDRVVIEYFAPELKAHADDIPILKYAAHHELVGKNRNAYRLRVFGFNGVARLAGRNKIDVATLDIANDFIYMLDRDMVPALMGGVIPAAVVAIERLATSNLTGSVLETAGMALAWWVIISTLAKFGFAFSQAELLGVNNGIFAVDHNFIDKVTIHLEDARRVFAANALEYMAKDLTKQEPDKKHQVMVVYPPHHNSRFQHYLHHPTLAKQLYYRAIHPWLVPKLSVYSKKDDSQNETAKRYSGWSLLKQVVVPLRSRSSDS
jgi:hypothetical protein